MNNSNWLTGFVGGSNRFILKVDRGCVARIHRAYAVAMALPSPRPIDGSNRFILRVDRDCVVRIHRAYAVELALPSPRPQAGWKKARKREKREQRREHMAASSNHCISTVSRGHLEKVLKIANGHPKIFTAYLRCPVTTSKSAQKLFSSLWPKV